MKISGPSPNCCAGLSATVDIQWTFWVIRWHSGQAVFMTVCLSAHQEKIANSSEHASQLKVWMKSPWRSEYGANVWMDACTVAGWMSSREVS